MDEIRPECLNTLDRIFVSFDHHTLYLRTTTSRFRKISWKIFWCHIWVVKLKHSLWSTPKPGQKIRLTMWHDSFPVKIEVSAGGRWVLIYELEELPDGHKCLAECVKE